MIRDVVDSNQADPPPDADPADVRATSVESDNDDAALVEAAQAATPAAVSVSTASATLPPTAPSRRPSRGGRIALVIALIVIAALSIGYVKLYAPRAELLRVQRLCMTDHPRPETVVYDDQDPTVRRVPDAWREFRRRVLPGSPDPADAVLFMHERQTEVGVRGLVCVEADRANRQLRITFIRPGAMLFEPIPITTVTLTPPPKPGIVYLTTGDDPFAAKLPPEADGPDARADLRIFAGQPDPKDVTRFTIPYEHAAQRGELDMAVHDEQTIYYRDRRFAGR